MEWSKFPLILVLIFAIYFAMYGVILWRTQKSKNAKRAVEEQYRKIARQLADDIESRNLQLEALAMEKRERQKLQAQQERRKAHEAWRDGPSQNEPYTYQIGRHANETLALRYGIANVVSDSDHRAKNSIRLKKIRRAGMLLGNELGETSEDNCYLVQLVDFRNREALAIIGAGEEFVRTFYPRSKVWFDNNEKLETVVKGNATMSLKEIVGFHISHAVY